MPNLLFWFLPLLVLASTNAQCSHEDSNLTLFVFDFAQRTRSCLGRHTRSPYGLSKQVCFLHYICGTQNDILNLTFCISLLSFADLGHMFNVRIKVQDIVHWRQNSHSQMLQLPPQIPKKMEQKLFCGESKFCFIKSITDICVTTIKVHSNFQHNIFQAQIWTRRFYTSLLKFYIFVCPYDGFYDLQSRISWNCYSFNKNNLCICNHRCYCF